MHTTGLLAESFLAVDFVEDRPRDAAGLLRSQGCRPAWQITFQRRRMKTLHIFLRGHFKCDHLSITCRGRLSIERCFDINIGQRWRHFAWLWQAIAQVAIAFFEQLVPKREKECRIKQFCVFNIIAAKGDIGDHRDHLREWNFNRLSQEIGHPWHVLGRKPLVFVDDRDLFLFK